jgi:transcriptional regulator with XRE-family HTH domain
MSIGKDKNMDKLFLAGELPDDFAKLIGELIRKAREEHEYSQAQLSDLLQKRRATISDIENGKVLPSFETIISLATHLKKPLIYFIPEKYRAMVNEQESQTQFEQELLIQFRRLPENLQQIAIQQIKAMADIGTDK